MSLEDSIEFIIITGMSGAGKSQVVTILEDMNYYCIDNLPPKLLVKFIKLAEASKDKIEKIAVVVDIRAGEFFEDLFKELESLKTMGVEYKMLFLDASDEVLISRYKENRRVHPLNKRGSIIEGINLERKELKSIKEKSDYILDTSNSKMSEFKEEISEIFLNGDVKNGFSVIVNSFGFKNGILLDGDLVFDVRFLPNPYYIKELRPKTGRDKEIKDYVFQWEETEIFINKLMDMLDFLIPLYQKEGKLQLILGIGCTGGQHRSVAIANEIAKLLQDRGIRAIANHRDS